MATIFKQNKYSELPVSKFLNRNIFEIVIETECEDSKFNYKQKLIVDHIFHAELHRFHYRARLPICYTDKSHNFVFEYNYFFAYDSAKDWTIEHIAKEIVRQLDGVLKEKAFKFYTDNYENESEVFGVCPLQFPYLTKKEIKELGLSEIYQDKDWLGSKHLNTIISVKL